MQQDAIRRVRLMQQRAQRSVAGGESSAGPLSNHRSDSSSPAPDKKGAAPRRMHLRRNLSPPAGDPRALLEQLLKENDRTLLLVLLLILLQEDTDPTLILALIYMLL